MFETMQSKPCGCCQKYIAIETFRNLSGDKTQVCEKCLEVIKLYGPPEILRNNLSDMRDWYLSRHKQDQKPA